MEKKSAIGIDFTVKALTKYEDLPIKEGDYRIVYEYEQELGKLPFNFGSTYSEVYVALKIENDGIGGIVEIRQDLFVEMKVAGYIKIKGSTTQDNVLKNEGLVKLVEILKRYEDKIVSSSVILNIEDTTCLHFDGVSVKPLPKSARIDFQFYD